jgi:bidirectional [NiFe] hydrogenase diaphorase subunit
MKRPLPPSADKRWRIVDATMRRHGYSSNALIESLHTAQESFGYLDEQALRFVAMSLRAPLSKVYGVATFYQFFSLKPQGEHNCVVCMGTACYIKGAPRLLDALDERYQVKP